MFVSEMRSRLSRLGGRSTISLVVCAACLAALPAAASAATVEPYPKNGSSGASDGYLATDEGGLLSAGILAASTGVWESPNFVYHGSAGHEPALLTYRMRRQANLADFLAVAGTDATYRVDLINLAPMCR